MKTYTKEQLREIIGKHQKWLNGEEGGEHAVLTNTNLNGENLTGATLRVAVLTNATLRDATLRGAVLTNTTLRGADLTNATLRGADLTNATLTNTILMGADLTETTLKGATLTGADLTGVDLDYSCWPLWCGSLDVKVDKRIFAQLAYHLCRVIVDDEECKAAQAALYPIANQFHRVEECGRLPITREDEA